MTKKKSSRIFEFGTCEFFEGPPAPMRRLPVADTPAQFENACAAQIQAEFETAAASSCVAGMHESMQAPELRAVRPVGFIDIDVMLSTDRVPSSAAQRSLPLGHLASISSALRRLRPLRLDRRDKGALR